MSDAVTITPESGDQTTVIATAPILGNALGNVYTPATGGPVSLTNTISANVASVLLPAGNWDVTGVAIFTGGSTTIVYYTHASMSIVPNTDGLLATFYGGGPSMSYFSTINGSGFSVSAPMTRFSFVAPTTVYLVAHGVFTTNTLAASGVIRAVPV